MNKNKIIALIKLTRPANIVTAMADIMAGIAISGALALTVNTVFNINPLLELDFFLLMFSTIGLYGGGVVFNDVFDAKLDAIERPERPIPSGIITIRQASILGSSLLIVGVGSAFLSSILSGVIALSIAFLALLYDRFSKHHFIAGPLNMGLCRGGNLLLGISIINPSVFLYWYICLLPLIYIAAITLLSRGEVHGSKRNNLYFAFFLYCIVFALFLKIVYNQRLNYWNVFPFVFLLGFSVLSPLIKAIKNGGLPSDVMKSVKAGVISIIILDAAYTAGFAGIIYGLLVLALLPISKYLSSLFAVT